MTKKKSKKSNVTDLQTHRIVFVAEYLSARFPELTAPQCQEVLTLKLLIFQGRSLISIIQDFSDEEFFKAVRLLDKLDIQYE